MPDSPAKYRAISCSEHRAHHSDIREAAVAGNEFNYSTDDRVRSTTQLKWMYVLLGSATLVPWIALVNETPFFLSRLAGSSFSQAFPSYLNSVYMLTKLVCQFYCTFTSKRSSPSRRIFAAMIAAILLVTCLCLSTFVRGTPSTFFAYALLSGSSLAIAASYLITAAYAGAASLGTSFLQALFFGQAAVGAAAGAVQVVSSMIALWGSSRKNDPIDATQAMGVDGRDGQAEEIAARIFFAVSAIFLCVTLAAYTWLTRQPSYQLATDTREQHRGVRSPDEHTGLLADERQNPLIESNSRVYHVFRKNLIFMFSLVYIFSITLAIFPAISAQVKPVNPSIHPLLFTAVHFLVYGVGDLLGRSPNLFPCLVVWSGKKILVMSLLRTLFIPLILLCNFDRSATTASLPTIRSDILFMIIILAMGYTNGYVSLLALLAVSSLEHNPRLEGRDEDVDVAATLGGSFIIFGLVIGAFSSFGIRAMI